MAKRLFRLPYILCYLCALILGFKQIREADIWMQLSGGRWMLEHGITGRDGMSYTATGAKWTNLHWLYQLCIAVIEKIMGPHGVMLLQGLVNVVVLYLLLKTMHAIAKYFGVALSTLFTVLSALVFLGICGSAFAGRPDMMSYLFTAIFVCILWLPGLYSWKRLLWLVLLLWLWANMDEGFVVGILLLLAYSVGIFVSYLLHRENEVLKSAGVMMGITAASVAITLLNPNGITLWHRALESTLPGIGHSDKWITITDSQYWSVQGWAHVSGSVLAIVMWFGWLLKERKMISGPVAGYTISLLILLALSFASHTFIPFAQILLFPLLPVLISRMLKKAGLANEDYYRKLSTKTVLVSSLLAIAAYVSLAGNWYYKYIGSDDRYGLHIAMLSNSAGAADFIRSHNLKGPAFADKQTASALLWELHPDYKSFIDMRDENVFPEKIRRQYLEVSKDPKKIHDLNDRYRFNYVVINTSELLDLKQTLYWGDSFNVIYVDPVSTIFIKVNKQNEALNMGAEAQKLFYWPQEILDPAWAVALTTLFNPAVAYDEEDEINAPLHAARFYNSVYNYRISLKMLRPAINGELAENPEALATMADAYVGDANFSPTKEDKKKKLDSARMYYQAAFDIDEHTKNMYAGMASLALEEGNYEEAAALLEKQLASNKVPKDFEYYMAGIAYRNIWKSGKGKPDYNKIIKYLDKAGELNAENKRANLFVAEAYWYKGDKTNATKNIRIAMTPGLNYTEYERLLMDTLRINLGIKEPLPPMEMLKHEHRH